MENLSRRQEAKGPSAQLRGEDRGRNQFEMSLPDSNTQCIDMHDYTLQ
jgi:hypothetical protein